MRTQRVKVEPVGRREVGSRPDLDLTALAADVRPGVARVRVLRRLDGLFRTGSAPDPLPSGFLPGRLLTMSLWGPFDRTVQRLAGLWMPWQGKAFDPSTMTGVNLMTRGARAPLRLLFPSYEPERMLDRRMEVFPFRNRVGPGEVDPSVRVLKIDYDFEANPGFVIRRILDELVQIDEGVYLGKILFRLGRRFHPIGYFALRRAT